MKSHVNRMMRYTLNMFELNQLTISQNYQTLAVIGVSGDQQILTWMVRTFRFLSMLILIESK